MLPACAQITDLKAKLAAARAEIDASAAAVADAASMHSQINWLHNRLQSSLEEVQVGSRLHPVSTLMMFRKPRSAVSNLGLAKHTRTLRHH